MRVRVIKNFSGYRVGQIFDWADGMARIYLGRGMVEQVAEDAVLEEAAIKPRVEQAVISSRRKST